MGPSYLFLSASNPSKGNFLRRNLQLRICRLWSQIWQHFHLETLGWSSSCWTAIVKVNNILECLANESELILQLFLHLYYWENTYFTVTVLGCVHIVLYIFKALPKCQVLLSVLSTDINSPQAPKLFCRIFEDYLIIQSVLHMLILRHFKFVTSKRKAERIICQKDK